MSAVANFLVVLFVEVFIFGSAHATSTSAPPAWQKCVELKGLASPDKELECYRIAAEARQEAARQTSILTSRPNGLINEWHPENALLSVYKLNYVLVYSKNSSANDAPTSPNPQNQVPSSYPLDRRDLKFQFSIKHDLGDLGKYGSLWFAYTQRSFWQLYDATNSRPFRENNYEPELIYSINPQELLPGFVFNPTILNIGLVHQSNGQSNPRSRSWNRIYLSPGIEHDYGNGRKVTLLVRFWQRVKEPAATDDNPDITDYAGYGDLELRYALGGKWEATAIASARAFELNLSAPWESIRLLTMAAPGEHNTNIHIQYFSGYGESLIDYNHKHTSWGVGISFPFE